MRILAIALCTSFCLMNLACGPSTSTLDSDLDAKRPSPKLLNEEQIAQLAESQHFPTNADEKLTPGVRCKRPDSKRYPEKINYCERRVSTSLKDRVIRDYDKQLGFDVEDISRNKIKIDHYIPLCMGGDNDKTNLGPQHEAIYTQTDPLENKLCLALSRGLITQDEAIDQMMTGKAHIDEVKTLLNQVDNLLH